MAKKTLIIWFLLIGILLLEATSLLRQGHLPFWYDPGRDLLLARSNLQKISLIGPPSGIPDVFYLPYWTWLLSLPLIFTRDPRLITFLTFTLPYFLLFPLVFYLFVPVFGRLIIFSLSLLFLLSYPSYATQLWSPNLGPLLFLILAYLVTTARRSPWRHGLVGFVAALGIGFNMGFGIAIALSTTAFYFLLAFRSRLSYLVSYLIGLGLALVPFFLFESRHGFFQTRSLARTLAGHSGVTLSGLSRSEIIDQLFSAPGHLLQLPGNLAIIILALALLYAAYLHLNKKIPAFTSPEKTLSFFLLICFLGLSYIYFFSKNPKWDYHFIGLEIFILLGLGLLAKKTRLGLFLALWVTALLAIHLVNPPRPNYAQNLYLAEKEKTIDLIYKDAAGQPFAVESYNPAIYTYDYDYLFKWLGEEKYHQLPRPVKDSTLLYLIIPPTSDAVRLDFIHFKAPKETYQIVSNRPFEDNTIIVKTQKIPPAL